MTRIRVIVGAVLMSGAGLLSLPGGLLAASREERGGDGELTLSGRVGQLEFDLSNKARVISFAGRPAAMGRGDFGDREPAYVAMGYGCQEHGGPLLFQVDHFDRCRTVFFISVHTRKLVGFRSLSPRFLFRGARTGLGTRVVDQRTGGEAGAGCFEGYVFGSRHDHASVWGFVTGGRDRRERGGGRHIVGGHLKILESESHRYPIGLLTC